MVMKLTFGYSTVEPIFNDISNSDNCCYNDRFTNPGFFPLFESYNLFLE